MVCQLILLIDVIWGTIFNEGTSWMIDSHAGTTFALARQSERIAIASISSISATCNVSHSGGLFQITTSGNSAVLKEGYEASSFAANTTIICDQPCVIVANHNENEYNMFGLIDNVS